jgi:hypothetical protein
VAGGLQQAFTIKLKAKLHRELALQTASMEGMVEEMAEFEKASARQA